MPRGRRRRGSGSFETLPNGRVRVWYSGGLGPNGKRVRQSKTFDTRNDADWWLREAKRQGRAPDTGETVSEYLDRWLRSKRSLRDSTRLQYENHLGHLKRELGAIPVSQLQRRHVEAFVDDMQRHVSKGTKRPLTKATVGKILTTLRSALEWGVPRELPDNVAAKVEAPRHYRQPVRAVTRAEVRAIVAAVKGEWFEQIVRFLLGSGLRIGEAVALDHDHVHDGWVEVHTSKTKVRAVRVSEDGMAALREAMGPTRIRKRDVPVFRSPKTGERLTRHALAHALPRHLGRSGLPRLTPHGLRHATATVMVASGVHMRIVAEQLGHSNPAMTARVYAHVAPESTIGAVAVLDEALVE